MIKPLQELLDRMIQFRVFLRNKTGELEVQKRYDISFCTDYDDHADIIHTEFSHEATYCQAVMFSSLDLSQPIPDTIKCVVCKMATDKMCEGDIVSINCQNKWGFSLGSAIGILTFGDARLDGSLTDILHRSNVKILCWHVRTDHDVVLCDIAAIDNLVCLGHAVNSCIKDGRVIKR